MRRPTGRPTNFATDFADVRQEWRRLFAEILGTFLLVLVAAGGAVVSGVSHGSVGRAAAVVAPGLVVMAVIYTMGEVSGAHLNPAVTLAFAVRGNFPWRRVAGYVVAQLVGAVLAALALRAMFGTAGQLGATVPGPGDGAVRALAMEALLTMGLVTVILGVSSGPRNVGHNAAIAIGAYVALAGLWASPISGASMNPARSIGPDLVRLDFHATWIYIVGPVVGSLVAVAIAVVLRGPPSEAAGIAAQGRLEDPGPPRRPSTAGETPGQQPDP